MLPAQAQLRIMAELIIKFLWCLYGGIDNVEKRLRIWEKNSAKEKKRLDEWLLPIANKDMKVQLENEINALKEKIHAEQCLEKMPKTAKLFEELIDVFDRNVYTTAYLQFNSSVHIDTHILTSIVEHQNEGKIFRSDLDENINKLKLHLLSFTYMFVKPIYLCYNWTFDYTENEYQKTISYFKNDLE